MSINTQYSLLKAQPLAPAKPAVTPQKNQPAQTVATPSTVGESVTLSAPSSELKSAPSSVLSEVPATAPESLQTTQTKPNEATRPLVVLSDSLQSVAQPEYSKSIDGFLSKFVSARGKEVGTVTAGQLSFDKASDVVSSAQKFIIPVPTFAATGGGERLVYPEGAKDKGGTDLAGQPITDWQGKPIAGPDERGVVFFNHKDQSYQAVKADGNGVVILNQVTEEQGKKLQSKIGEDPGKLSLKEFKDALEFAHAELGVGDMYNSDRDFIKSKMNPMETSETGVPQYGLYRRDDRDVCQALYIEGSGEFQGPAATPQKFENGAVIIRQPDAKAPDGFSYRLIQPDAFVETYKNKNGSAIELEKLPRHQ